MTLVALSDPERLRYALESLIEHTPNVAVRQRLQQKLVNVRQELDRRQRKGVIRVSHPAPNRATADRAARRGRRAASSRTPWSAAFSDATPRLQRRDVQATRHEARSEGVWTERLACQRCQWATDSDTRLECPRHHPLEARDTQRLSDGWRVR